MHNKTLFVASVLILGVTIGSCGPAAEPNLHAQCKVIWLLGAPCRDVYVALVNQIKAWSTRASCESGGENCLYELVSASPVEILARHTSPTTQYIYDLSFGMFPPVDNVCRVTADSISESWASLMEHGSNYCSLKNLIKGSALDQVDGFKEYTNEWICLGYSLANCTIY